MGVRYTVVATHDVGLGKLADGRQLGHQLASPLSSSGAARAVSICEGDKPWDPLAYRRWGQIWLAQREPGLSRGFLRCLALGLPEEVDQAWRGSRPSGCAKGRHCSAKSPDGLGE
jgi:hypothetical protein